jgi:SAM-dependent methyltransferase
MPESSKWRRLLRPARLVALRRTGPVSDSWGFDRGTPVDRHFIEDFLERCRSDVRGRVLEVKDGTYTHRFGSGVVRSDVLDVDPQNPAATIVADLARAEAIPEDTFDCFILTQTLQFVYDLSGAVRHALRILKPGGVLLATVPCVSRIGGDADCWRFTPESCRRLFGGAFGEDNVELDAPGNCLLSLAFLTGMAAEELRASELGFHDARYPLIVTVRGVKRTPY